MTGGRESDYTRLPEAVVSRKAYLNLAVVSTSVVSTGFGQKLVVPC